MSMSSYYDQTGRVARISCCAVQTPAWNGL